VQRSANVSFADHRIRKSAPITAVVALCSRRCSWFPSKLFYHVLLQGISDEVQQVSARGADRGGQLPLYNHADGNAHTRYCTCLALI